MNNIYKTLCASALVLTSCEKHFDPVPDNYDTVIVLKEFGEQQLTLYDTGEDGIYEVGVFKSGKDPQSTTQVGLRIMDESALAIYSQEIGRNYKALPNSSYELQNEKLDFSSSDRYKGGKIIFKTNNISALITSNPNENYVLPVELYKINAKDSINDQKKLLLLKPQVVVPKISYGSNGMAMVDISQVSEVTYNLTLTLPFVSPWDFECQMALPANGVFNSEQVLLENGGKIVFKKGHSVSEPLPIKIVKVGDLIGNKAIIPLNIITSSKEGIRLPDSPFLLDVVYGGDYHKITLLESMLSTNAQEQSEGPIRDLIDGNESTYFHSNWSNSGAINEPHYIQISLNESITKVAFAYQNRNNNNGKPQEVKIWVSENGSQGSWKEVAHITEGMPTGAASKYSSYTYASDTPFKYFRFEVLRTNSGTAPTFFNMAEFILYGK